MKKRLTRALAASALIATSAALLVSCESIPIRPQVNPSPDVPSAGRFPHERLGFVLEKVVSPDGLVDYAALALEQTSLEEYLAEVARVSPDSHPPLFPSDDDRLAYWLNAHNACALKNVIHWNRPAKLNDISHRFDSETKFIVGAKPMSLNDISNGVIRKRYKDPRVHAALVKARRGGPPLSKAVFTGASVEQLLEASMKAFVMDERAVQWTPPSTEVRLSRLFFDFRSDFERQQPATSVSGDARLIAEVDRWRAPGKKLIATRAVPIPFDERLNDVANR